MYSEISNQLGLMVYLNIEDDTKNLYLFIKSHGGWVILGVAIYDTMQFVRQDVYTICMGLAASMWSFIWVGGEITKRLAFPHTWHQWCVCICECIYCKIILIGHTLWIIFSYVFLKDVWKIRGDHVPHHRLLIIRDGILWDEVKIFVAPTWGDC